MSLLPDEIWSKILEMGTTTFRLSCRDLCSLAITSRRHNRLSCDPFLWSIILSIDFPQPISSPPSSCSSSSMDIHSKCIYRTRFERDKARMVAAHSRAILIAESHVYICRERLHELEGQLRKEGERMKTTLEELRNLERVRQATVALNVWQPEIVRGSQRQMVEQCTVPFESRLSSLKMELCLCKHQIAVFKKAHNEQNGRLGESEAALSALKYRPLESNQANVPLYGHVKRRKIKSSSSTNLY